VDEPVIDCHVHVFDPSRFPYAPDAYYLPTGPETGTVEQLRATLDVHGVRHALLVGPNSGYGEDNRCLLDAVSGSGGRFRGVAVVPNRATASELSALRDGGVLGVTLNTALLGVDHCGRPDPVDGLDAPGFRELLGLGRGGRAVVKLSGLVKFSRRPPPHEDTWPFVRALVDAFGPDRCVWASDWPFLRAPVRIDYGPLLALFEELVPDRAARRQILWDTPRREFGFPG
jgi:predicted TIM-barrel fold metal-dependent hydrolase